LPPEPTFHDATEEEVETAFVIAMGNTARRRAIFAAYQSHGRAWLAIIGPMYWEQWLDGRFTTNMHEPEDVDLVTWLPDDDVNRLPIPEQERLLKLFPGKDKKPGDLVHAFYQTTFPPGHRRAYIEEHLRGYWQQRFGEDRSGVRKGIVRLTREVKSDEHNGC
jgi:hypothetical protein